jgi:hypothetical protein
MISNHLWDKTLIEYDSKNPKTTVEILSGYDKGNFNKYQRYTSISFNKNISKHLESEKFEEIIRELLKIPPGIDKEILEEEFKELTGDLELRIYGIIDNYIEKIYK